MMKVVLVTMLLFVCVCAKPDRHYYQKRAIFQQALDARTDGRDLQRCWLDTSGQCCKRRVSDCRHVRRYNTKRTRANYFHFIMLPFYPGNFMYGGCNVQCLCSQPSPCGGSGGGGSAPVTNRPPQTAPPQTAAPPQTQPPQVVTTAAPAVTNAPQTQAPTTTPTRFCPAEATTQPGRRRILNGTPVSDCTTYPGIVSIVEKSNGKTRCTGVVTSSLTIDMPSNCAQLMSVILEIREPNTGKLIVELPTIDTSTVPTGGPYTITLADPMTTNSCPGIACVYDPAMVNDVDLDSCVAVGAGYANTAGSGTASVSFMQVPTLRPTADCPNLLEKSPQSDLFDLTLTYNCFTGRGSSTCAGDVGAPIMCPLTSGEIVIIGQTENIPCRGQAIVGFFNLEATNTRVLRLDPMKVKVGSGSRHEGIILGSAGHRRSSIDLTSRVHNANIVVSDSAIRNDINLQSSNTRQLSKVKKGREDIGKGIDRPLEPKKKTKRHVSRNQIVLGSNAASSEVVRNSKLDNKSQSRKGRVVLGKRNDQKTIRGETEKERKLDISSKKIKGSVDLGNGQHKRGKSTGKNGRNLDVSQKRGKEIVLGKGMDEHRAGNSVNQREVTLHKQKNIKKTATVQLGSNDNAETENKSRKIVLG